MCIDFKSSLGTRATETMGVSWVTLGRKYGYFSCSQKRAYACLVKLELTKHDVAHDLSEGRFVRPNFNALQLSEHILGPVREVLLAKNRSAPRR